MFCPKCGTEVDETYNFCYNCGEKLDFKKVRESERKKGKTTSKIAKTKQEKKETIKVKLECFIRGMDLERRPDGSFFEMRLARANLNDAINHIKNLPKKDDFPEKLLKNLKKKKNLCPPTVIFTNDYTLEVSTIDGEKFQIETRSFSNLAGHQFINSDGSFNVVEVDEDGAIEIVTEFFKRVDRVKKLRLGLTPLELSTLIAIKNGISNSKKIASVTGSEVDKIREIIKNLVDKGFIIRHKKGFFRKKYWYELTPQGEKKLNNSRKRLEKVVGEDRDIIDIITPAFWIMYATNDIIDGVDSNDILDTIGTPPEVVDIEASAEESGIVDFDTIDIEGDGNGDGGDWGDGDGDGW